MYADETLGESTTRAVFLEPGTGQILGDYPVYGSSGSLPFRTRVSGLHRNLHLGGDWRLYNELAASWLWVIAVSGLVLWVVRARRLSRKRTPSYLAGAATDSSGSADRTDFAAYPLAAKLTRWGIDLHMGTHFGLANQLVLFVLALAALALCAWGYLMWWQRRPRGARTWGSLPPLASLAQVPLPVWLLLAVAAVAVGLFLPLLGLSLLAFTVCDLLIYALRRKA